MHPIIPLPRTAQTPADVRVIAEIVRVTEPEMYAVVLPGEDLEETIARRAAAADIVDELLFELADDGPQGPAPTAAAEGWAA